jgi:hypothetical protein
VKEFNTRFDKLYDHIPVDLCPPPLTICVLYTNSFEGKFGFILKDKQLILWLGPKNTVRRLKKISLAQILILFSFLVPG